MKEFIYFRYLSSGYRRYHTFARFYAVQYIALMVVTALCMRLCPTNCFVKALIVLCCAGFVAGALMFARRQRNRNPVILAFVLALLLIFLIFVCVQFYKTLPADYERIEKRYMKYALSYEGVPYRRGGETRYGIDTAGIAKAALFRSGLEYGIRFHNVRVLARAAALWWRSLDNRRLLKGGGYTRVVRVYRHGSGIDFGSIEKGDMVYVHETHSLIIYAGDGNWIVSRPKTGTFIADTKDACGDSRLTHLRWRVFQNE
ncbi:MAG: hypothetical protein IJT95_04365 [Abditibacteriota bacterium]|nr:hypothetical protein [Abditibacteriota bacterium]